MLKKNVFICKLCHAVIQDVTLHKDPVLFRMIIRVVCPQTTHDYFSEADYLQNTAYAQDVEIED